MTRKQSPLMQLMLLTDVPVVNVNVPALDIETVTSSAFVPVPPVNPNV